jgi:hypothetical protein
VVSARIGDGAKARARGDSSMPVSLADFVAKRDKLAE